ncbi:hypothetical protein CC1G_14573 [Coprinopsis cinerea okayama7|uniref:Uncharacterized protein n=1 Tax=Coprinopsis cinerea (strain Okayama-7 / 130 / ATCC MYA-4618 / FGSC 9003) TaxID=240176 RepID=D6RMP5_COPC7|nr:hypothetical protein CC1G_14573 [Coprinopsis cinerea okayama7\|eukprot:XP_002911141.1 hypothetical protein CC1G_14573 [Coprinopsis cinerea okayama7\
MLLNMVYICMIYTQILSLKVDAACAAHSQSKGWLLDLRDRKNLIQYKSLSGPLLTLMRDVLGAWEKSREFEPKTV